MRFTVVIAVLVAGRAVFASEFVEIPAGEFMMGSADGAFDERPVHKVTFARPFLISTNDFGIGMSWDEAVAYCKRLGKQYRLPTEAEWEYACRTRPDLFSTNQVEHWCLDWYGPYPGHYTDGDFRVTRSAALGCTKRLGMLPDDRSPVVGFRIVQAAAPAKSRPASRAVPRWAQRVSQRRAVWKDISEPYFAEPVPFVKIPDGMNGPLFTKHNHDPALTWCDNGDLLAIWYSTITEPGRELAIAASRLRHGSNEWDEADVFWDAPGRNDHAPALLRENRGKLYHFNGLAVGEGWADLALVMRTSTDNGATWSKARLIGPTHGYRHQPIPSPFITRNGLMVLPCDAVPGGAGGTAVQLSRDAGKTWTDPGAGQPKPEFAAGKTGAWIAGIHAGVVPLKDGRWLAFGRGDDIDGHMPQSVSADEGRAWTYSASPWPPISSGQRLVLMRLREGPLLFVSFASPRNQKKPSGMTFVDSAGQEFTGYGLFAAVSFDECQTWPVRKLMTDAKPRTMSGGAWTGGFPMDATHAETGGYLAATQTPDGMIHLISSRIYYRFNLAWLKQPN